jgi:hypothetical protein
MRILATVAVTTALAACDLAAQAPGDTTSPWMPVETVTTTEGLEIPDTMVLRNGRRLNTELHDTRFLAFLPSPPGPPYLVLAGRECGACDAIEAVYIQSPSGRPPRPPGPWLYGPGVSFGENNSDTTSVIRVFLGRCLANMTVGVVSFVRARGRTGAMERRVRIIDLSADTLRVRDLAEPLPTDDDVLPFVQSSRCRELQ